MGNSGSEPPKGSDWIRDLGIFGIVVGEVITWTGIGLGLGYLLRTRVGSGDLVWVLCTGAGFTVAILRISRLGRKKGTGR